MLVVLHLFMSTWSTRDLCNSTYRMHAHRITSFAKDATSWSWACKLPSLDAWWNLKLGISLHNFLLWGHRCHVCYQVAWFQSLLRDQPHHGRWYGSLQFGHVSQEWPLELTQFTILISVAANTHGEQTTKGATICRACKSRCHLFSGSRQG